MDFVFYDLETTGRSPAFDQPLQFAAIRTDDRLVERERVNIRCRLAPHIIPSPEALAVNGVDPETLVDPSLPSLFEFAREVNALIGRWAPAIWTGYNSMSFDEEFLRQTFYQNLLPDVFATQFNQNMRFDILPAVFAVHVRNEGLFNWPRNDEEQPVFRLDLLARANGFESHDAHDALGDAEATLRLARVIAEREPALWAELVSNADVRTVEDKLKPVVPVELVVRPVNGPPHALVGCACGISKTNQRQVGFLDLEETDPQELMDADDAELSKALESRKIRNVYTNRAPALLECCDPAPETARRARAVAGNQGFIDRVGQAMADRYAKEPDEPPKPVERRIYDGFPSYDDKQWLRSFHMGDWKRRYAILRNLRDDRLRQLGVRLVAYHSPDTLSGRDRSRFERFLRERWSAPDAPETEWGTLERARREVAKLRDDGRADAALLDSMEAFLGRFASP